MTRLPDQTPRKLTATKRRAIIERDNSTCSRCGEVTDKPQVDHWTPLFLGGKEDGDNLRVICGPCHVVKSSLEAKVRAKIRRITGLNKPKRKTQIQSRGFDTRFKKKLNGEVVAR